MKLCQRPRLDVVSRSKVIAKSFKYPSPTTPSDIWMTIWNILFRASVAARPQLNITAGYRHLYSRPPSRTASPRKLSLGATVAPTNP